MTIGIVPKMRHQPLLLTDNFTDHRILFANIADDR